MSLYDISTLEHVNAESLKLERIYEKMQKEEIQSLNPHFNTWLALENKILTFIEIRFLIDNMIRQAGD